jgi:hypothetical protein
MEEEEWLCGLMAEGEGFAVITNSAGKQSITQMYSRARMRQALSPSCSTARPEISWSEGKEELPN